ncbi:MAG: RHS repeat protein, partial [Xanthomonadales bacterium]|nr:RHS repeat protein [Xanthomonadales bacterium]
MKKTQYLYDSAGDQHAIIDPLNVRTEQEFDALDRLTRTLQDYGVAPGDINAETLYEYDVSGNLIKVTDPKGLDTSYVYDKLNDQTELHSPDTGTTTYEYDSAGNRSAQTDARGVRSEYSYDVLNRLTAIVYPSETVKNISFVYDLPFTNECPTGNHPLGRLTRYSDPTDTTTLCYDHRGNVIRKTQTQGTTKLITQWTYDGANRVSGITYPSGKGVSISRDLVGRINHIELTGGATLASVGGGTTLISGVLYEPFGPVRELTYGDGYVQSRSYDQNYWVQSITSTRPGGLQAYFDQDEVGNITSLSATSIGSGGGSGRDRSIGYDDLYRISEVHDRNAALIESFSYDATGNRLSKTSTNGVATGSYGYPTDSHRLNSVDGTPRYYDQAGNLTWVDGGASSPGFVYDARNRLIEAQSTSGFTVTTATYDHNARGERVSRGLPSSGGFGSHGFVVTKFAYDESGRLLGEYSSYGNPIQEVIWLDDLPVATLRGGFAYPIESDHLGSPRLIAQEAISLWQWDLLGPVFGEHAPNDTIDNGKLFRFDLRFPGQQYDAASGLNYNYFRDY